MTTDPPTKKQALANIDGRYLAEYIAFAGQMREYVNETLGRAWRADPNPVRRAHHLLSVVQLEYAAYEDAAAMLSALLRFHAKKSTTVLETLESYPPGEAIVSKVLDAAHITGADELFAALGLDAGVPALWRQWFPDLDLEKSLRLACRFFVHDCRANHKPHGIAAYNKSKHGPLVVSSGEVLGPRLAPVPSMFFAAKRPEEHGGNPVIVYGWPDDPETIETHERAVHFVQRSLRLIVSVLLPLYYPDEVQRRYGGPEAMWRQRELRDIVEFIDEITRKK